MLASASLAREAEFLLGACVLALATPLPLLLFTELSAQRIYIAQLLVAILAAVLGSLPWSRRLLVPKRAERAACHRAALAQFVLRGLDRSQCGVLVYVSLAEHYIRIVPAEDAARAVTKEQWQSAVDEALGPLAAGALEAALTVLADALRRTFVQTLSAGRGVGAAAAAALPCGLKVIRQFGGDVADPGTRTAEMESPRARGSRIGSNRLSWRRERDRLVLRPRGPRSGPGYAVPVRHHLIDPIRTTRGRIPTSPHGGLYGMPSLCGSA